MRSYTYLVSLILGAITTINANSSNSAYQQVLCGTQSQHIRSNTIFTRKQGMLDSTCIKGGEQPCTVLDRRLRA
ncbi:hypothetical protein F5Y08DRAFT_315671 [Xylaria arbuscula]|nr:hypothetical protein F5Y08DRAFT_315671 [Xylaria arbuscula]